MIMLNLTLLLVKGCFQNRPALTTLWNQGHNIFVELASRWAGPCQNVCISGNRNFEEAGDEKLRGGLDGGAAVGSAGSEGCS